MASAAAMATRKTSVCFPPFCSRANTARGFTLLELLVVMALLGLLGSVVGPVVWRAIENAQRRGQIADAEAFLRRFPETRFRQAAPFQLTVESLTRAVGTQAENGRWAVDRPIRFSRRGSCEGGEVVFFPAAGGPPVSFFLAPVTCELVRGGA